MQQLWHLKVIQIKILWWWVEFEKRKNYAVKAINEIGTLSTYDPDGAFYLFINIKKFSNDSMKFWCRFIKKAKV